MVGTYGMVSHLMPSGFRGPRDRYTDVAFDAQFDREWQSGASLRGTRDMDPRVAHASTGTAGDGGAINTSTATSAPSRVDATYYWPSRVGFSAGLFSTTGSSDSLLYPADAVTGSATGSPNSQGYILQLSFMPWLNTRFGRPVRGVHQVQRRQPGLRRRGRDASDNNTLYLMTWLVF